MEPVDHEQGVRVDGIAWPRPEAGEPAKDLSGREPAAAEPLAGERQAARDVARGEDRRHLEALPAVRGAHVEDLDLVVPGVFPHP